MIHRKFEPIEAFISTVRVSSRDCGDGIEASIHQVRDDGFCYILNINQRSRLWLDILKQLHESGIDWCKAKIAWVHDIVAHDPLFSDIPYSVVSLIIPRHIIESRRQS